MQIIARHVHIDDPLILINWKNLETHFLFWFYFLEWMLFSVLLLFCKFAYN